MRRLHVTRATVAAILAALCLAGPFSTLHADITSTGDVDPAVSTWTSSTTGYVGRTADGTLTVNDDSDLNSYRGYIGYEYGGTGVVTVDGGGSTWTSLSLTVGAQGKGTLNITNGGAVSGGSGCIGSGGSASSVVTVDGSGSTWTNNSNLVVGNYGCGTLNITDGGDVSNRIGYIGYIGYHPYSVGTVTVDGTGSTWTNSSSLYVGSSAYRGTLNITGGAAVSATEVSINSNKSRSRLAIDIGNGSLLTVDGGSGTITNDGTVRVMAGAGPTAGAAYSPISAGTWSGGGTYQAIGGTWNETEHEFTVSGVQSGTSGTMATIDLADTQRLLIADGGTGWSVGASFLAMADSSELNFTATAVTGETLTDLEALLEPGQLVKGAWEFIVAGDGYTSGDPAYLSFDVGAGYSRSDLHLWRYDGTDWTECGAMALTYDGTYASFTVTGFSGYAVAAVPEPGTLVSLLIGAATLALFARRRG